MVTIKGFIRREKNIVHGRQALNKQLPKNLHRPTDDWDLWDRTPERDADKLQGFLDKKAGWDRYYKKSIPLTGSKQKVHRVIDRISESEVADYMKTPKRKKLYKKIGGIRYERLDHAKKVYKKILKDKELAFRHPKAQYDLYTIEQHEKKLNGNKKKLPSKDLLEGIFY